MEKLWSTFSHTEYRPRLGMGPSSPSSNIRVVIRVCPHREKDRGKDENGDSSSSLVNIHSDGDSVPKKITVRPYHSLFVNTSKGADAGTPRVLNSHKFVFDAVHGPKSTQGEVYDSVKDIVEGVIEG